jgi:hypothetical protein
LVILGHYSRSTEQRGIVKEDTVYIDAVIHWVVIKGTEGHLKLATLNIGKDIANFDATKKTDFHFINTNGELDVTS